MDGWMDGGWTDGLIMIAPTACLQSERLAIEEKDCNARVCVTRLDSSQGRKGGGEGKREEGQAGPAEFHGARQQR